LDRTFSLEAFVCLSFCFSNTWESPFAGAGRGGLDVTGKIVRESGAFSFSLPFATEASGVTMVNSAETTRFDGRIPLNMVAEKSRRGGGKNTSGTPGSTCRITNRVGHVIHGPFLDDINSQVLSQRDTLHAQRLRQRHVSQSMDDYISPWALLHSDNSLLTLPLRRQIQGILVGYVGVQGVTTAPNDNLVPPKSYGVTVMDYHMGQEDILYSMPS
jgi:hypothetical protein